MAAVIDVAATKSTTGTSNGSSAGCSLSTDTARIPTEPLATATASAAVDVPRSTSPSLRPSETAIAAAVETLSATEATKTAATKMTRCAVPCGSAWSKPIMATASAAVNARLHML